LTRSILQSDRKAISGTGAQAEREAMLERQREGIAKAKHDGDVKGVCRLKQEGVRPSAIALRLGIGRASVYWALGSRDVRVRGEDLCLYGSTEQ
jgi:DNA invertase Pin-like site-specific DNA recombinase